MLWVESRPTQASRFYKFKEVVLGLGLSSTGRDLS